MAQNVMTVAQGWPSRPAMAHGFDADLAFGAWDQALKVSGVNPDRSADLSVVTLMVARLAWH